MALTATGIYQNTVTPDTANTSLSTPRGGSYKQLAVGSSTAVIIIDKVIYAYSGDTTDSAIFVFLWNGTVAQLVGQTGIQTNTVRLNAIPIIGPLMGGIPLLGGPVTLPDNTWELDVIVYTSQAVNVTATGNKYT